MALPLPPFYCPERVGAIWRVPYEDRARAGRAWAQTHGLEPAARDRRKVSLLLIDMQVTFCLPESELFVAGRSGRAAVDDTRRVTEFIYRNLDLITSITASLDTHQAAQIFHSLFFVDAHGNHPPAYTHISHQDLLAGRWRVNPHLAAHFNLTSEDAQRLLLRYTHSLETRGKYHLTIWPYHAMLGGVGHALVPALEEAIFFHTIARHSPPRFELKGLSPFSEYYSVLGPEVPETPHSTSSDDRHARFLEMLTSSDMLIVAGEAKSHCVAWTLLDLLDHIQRTDPALARKVYLLEDCTSPVVVPGVVDYTDDAEAAFSRLADAGMQRVRACEDETWFRSRLLESRV